MGKVLADFYRKFSDMFYAFFPSCTLSSVATTTIFLLHKMM